MQPATATTLSTSPAPGRPATLKPALSASLKAGTGLLCGLATCQALAAPVTIDYAGALTTFTVQTTGTTPSSAAGAQGSSSLAGGLGGRPRSGLEFEFQIQHLTPPVELLPQP